MKLRGTIYTDGVGVLVLKRNYDTKKKGGSSGGKPKSIELDEFQYIEKLGKEDLLAGADKCVLIDSGRRDLLCYKFVEYLQERAKVTPVMKVYYLNEDLPAAEDQGADGFLPFRKMKLESFINRQQANKWLAKKFKERFRNGAILILDNWSAGNVKYHEPIRGGEMRRMLVNEGFQVYLLDQLRASSLCPSCQNGELETFKKVQNPRPYQREKYPIADCHGLLRCKSQRCLKAVTRTIEATDKVPLCRLWNRDMAATLNFRHILFSLRANVTAALISDTVTDDNQGQIKGMSTELTIYGYNEEPLPSVEIAHRNKDAVFNSLFDMEKVQHTCESNGLKFGQRMSVLPKLKVVRILGVKKTIVPPVKPQKMFYLKRILRDPNILLEGQKPLEDLKAETAKLEKEVKSLDQEREKALKCQKEQDSIKKIKALRKEWHNKVDKQTLYQRIEEERHLRDKTYLKINDIEDQLMEKKQVLYYQRMAIRHNSRIHTVDTTSTLPTTKKELKKDSRGLIMDL
ncbi:hypothetical protein G6F46_004041 [Rhizopus delemar]|uniref:Uncharacterized protein n=1 Tax=Rhizopus oryzae TaxID=64495 RepID=A0A9P6YFW8_RHIOR|nr:hypothetical protein G6F54_011150 [Rhizopus delemar]KAG1547484.1 hypothetical protein G6F51_004236 [Rhizopus arrhizus]KAG1498412.1 hypothetical protein G6F53_011747 [Rhizopus delemar]KAG1618278.1 hypothetical protein G6F46_004041 [Rhizopus delemar]KAG1632984.1 hypothetical protein G6F45_003740 [Rhizopus arrhizus]